jgi:hypothetical protein
MLVKDAYKRRYKMRVLGENGLNIVVSIPRVVIQREAEKRNLTIEEFLKQFKAVAQYDNFEGIIYTFEGITKEDELEKQPANPSAEGTDGGE